MRKTFLTWSWCAKLDGSGVSVSWRGKNGVGGLLSIETGRGGGALVVMVKLRGKVRGVDENIT